jgi:hypothetical protein
VILYLIYPGLAVFETGSKISCPDCARLEILHRVLASMPMTVLVLTVACQSLNGREHMQLEFSVMDRTQQTVCGTPRWVSPYYFRFCGPSAVCS